MGEVKEIFLDLGVVVVIATYCAMGYKVWMEDWREEE